MEFGDHQKNNKYSNTRASANCSFSSSVLMVNNMISSNSNGTVTAPDHRSSISSSRLLLPLPSSLLAHNNNPDQHHLMMMIRSSAGGGGPYHNPPNDPHQDRGGRGEDPALDQFMEAYCEMLAKYEQELTKPFKEAMLFLSSIEFQLKALTLSSTSDSACGDFIGQNGSSEEEVDVNDSIIDPQAEDKELKVQLLRKYSGYLGSLKQEFLKKKKNGKLPKEARQQLLDWWSRHYKWPYPSEAQKLALAESTGLDLKQINNWFINQRKRHWKPSEDMQFVMMDAAHPVHYYMDNIMYNPFPMDCSSTLL
ncbi:hypothetical protein TIFTF001_022897 [Ficus carica]|uniref:Uncharacterized protein n=1 Tax=Ficus carica TaxID=3494 RepID=A0AA88AJF2_FICCA|nr:hypothetical protein TIFTF001_022897 [Ficus carica]